MQQTYSLKKALFASVFIVVALLLSVSLLCLPATAAETEGYYTYTVLYGKGAAITNVSSAIFGDIVIPDTLGGYPVTSIRENAFQNRSSLTSVEIPSTVTWIGEYAFAGCTSLASINIPSSVTGMGVNAFLGCSSLASVIFEENSQLSIINGSAFSGCTSLATINIPFSVKSINAGAFGGCKSLTSIEIPSSVTSIGEGAFSYCSSLASITVDPANTVYHSAGDCLIETASKTLTAGCKNSIIPTDGSVTSIGSEAFYYCTSLTDIEIPSSVTSIGSYAFYQCHQLSNVYYGGTEEQWNAIFIDNKNDSLLNANILLADEIPALNANILLGDKFSANAKVPVPEGITVTEAGVYVDGVKMTGALTADGYYLVEGFLKTAAKETGKTVTVAPYYVAGDFEIVGNSVTTSIAKMLRSYLNDSDPEVVALATATLNYAAAAQVYFGYDTENLVNAGLVGTQPSGTYADNFAVTEAKPDAVVAPREIALLLNDTVDIHVKITAKSGAAVVDFATLSLAVSEHADMSEPVKVAFDAHGVAVVHAINPTNWNDTYYFRIVDENGNAVSATFSYGVSTYYIRMQGSEDANLVALIDSMMALYEANVDYNTPYIPEENETEQDNIGGIF